MNFEQTLAEAESARNISANFSKILNNFPRGANGLTPDSVKFSEEFKFAKSAYEIAFQNERRANAFLVKSFKKELSAHRKLVRGY